MTRYLPAVLGALAAALLVVANLPGPAHADTWYANVGKVNDQREVRIDPSAATSTLHALWCPGVASTTLPAAKRLSGAKSLMVHNKSSATCWLEFDGSSLVSTAVNGDEYAAGDKQSQDISEATFGAYIRAVCNAVTTTPNCLKLRWWK